MKIIKFEQYFVHRNIVSAIKEVEFFKQYVFVYIAEMSLA